MNTVNSSFEGKTKDFLAYSKGERASLVHHKDNLKMEGKIENRASALKAVASEKASQIKHQDSLKLEGSLDMRRRGTITLRTEKENTAKKEDNLKSEGSSEKLIQVNSAFYSKCACKFKIEKFEDCELIFCCTLTCTVVMASGLLL